MFRQTSRRGAICDRAARIMRDLGLPEGPRRVDSFSGGERQRVAVARALAANPPVLLTDEPTASLDRVAADRLIEDLITMVRRPGKTLITVSHDTHLLDRLDRLPRSSTPWDRAILVPVESVWAVHGLASGHAPDRADQIGPPFDAAYFPGTPAGIVCADELWANYALRSEFNRDAETMAFFPGTVLAELYRVMGDVRQAMSLMTVVTRVLVAASVLLGLFILSRLFQRQTAMLRALGHRAASSWP